MCPDCAADHARERGLTLESQDESGAWIYEPVWEGSYTERAGYVCDGCGAPIGDPDWDAWSPAPAYRDAADRLICQQCATAIAEAAARDLADRDADGRRIFRPVPGEDICGDTRCERCGAVIDPWR